MSWVNKIDGYLFELPSPSPSSLQQLFTSSRPLTLIGTSVFTIENSKHKCLHLCLPEHSVIFQQPQRFRLLGSIRVLMYKTDLKSKLVFKIGKLTFALGRAYLFKRQFDFFLDWKKSTKYKLKVWLIFCIQSLYYHQDNVDTRGQ